MISVELHLFQRLSPLISEYLEEIQVVDVTPYLVEESINADFQFEYSRVFDFISSKVSFDLTYGANHSGLLDFVKYSNPSYILTAKITSDGQAEFWGVLDLNVSSGGNYKELFSLQFNDLFSYVYNTVGKYLLSPFRNRNLSSFLTTCYNCFPSTRQAPVISVGDRAQGFTHLNSNPTRNSDGTRSSVDASSIYIDNYFYTITANDFLLDCQKFYNAFIYTDGNGVINFINREIASGNAVDITNDNWEEEDVSSFHQMSPYNSILANLHPNMVTEIPLKLNPAYMLLMNKNNIASAFNVQNFAPWTDINIMPILSDLSNIPSGFNYLDMRIRLSKFDPTFRVFVAGDESTYSNNLIDDFKSLIIPQRPRNIRIARTDLKPLSEVILQGQHYKISEAHKEYYGGYSDLNLVGMNSNYPSPFN